MFLRNKFWAQTVFNLKAQREAIMDNDLANAELNNDLVVPRPLREINSQLLNEIEIAFLQSEQNINVIRNHYQTLLPIAHQCPFAGGTAVYLMRTFVSMFNDSLEYNDDVACLLNGIYRQGQETTSLDEAQEIIVVPNPADDNVTIKLDPSMNGICYIEFNDAFGKLIFSQKLDCKLKSKDIDTSKMSNGIYYLKVKTDSLSIKKKVAIIH